MHRVSEVGIQSRRKCRLKRRIYNLKGANHLWHIDTNHKLVKWYLIIFEAIDGYSRLPISLECISNNKAPKVLACFLKCVHTMVFPAESGQAFGSIYYELFSFMEENTILDPFNEVDVIALHFTFILSISEKLDGWRLAWSKHRV